MIAYAKRMKKMEYTANVVKNLFGSMTDPQIISFGGGAPAKEALPIEAVRQIADEVLRADTRGVEALQYGPIAGIRDLREVVIDVLLKPKGVECRMENVMIVAGGLEGINLICQAYIDPGDVILVESPTFVHSVEIFDMFEATCVGVSMDEGGLVTEELEEKIQKFRPKMLYTVPTFQNPSGRTLGLERRKKVAELAARYDILVLEDDPYRDIRYGGADLPPIKHFDRTGNVIVANSFSKIFSPGCRLGYVVGEADAIAHLTDVKSATNSHTSMLPQILCAEFFKRGLFPAHHKKLCDLYRERRDAMLGGIDRHFPPGTKHSDPEGGLFTWVELPKGIDTAELLKASTSNPEVKVAFVAGEGFFTERDGRGRNCMRMSFGSNPPERIETGLQRLGDLICSRIAAV
ncbi:MAG: PLP-dependent aminotransferase family protein [Fretibacterium sp.]|nr:PLP-dependent aminotransferase family protein [Fretibacterium sp.]